MSGPLFSPQDDLPLIADGGERVTLLREGREPGVTIGWAFRRPVPPVRGDRGDPLLRVEGVWTFLESAAPGGVRSGDVLRDADGRRWVVLAVSTAPAGRLAAWCRDTSAAFEPGSTIDIQIAEFRKGTHGEPMPVWRLFAAGVPCRWGEPPGDADAPQPGISRLWADVRLPAGTYRFRDRLGRMFAVPRIIKPGSLTEPAEIEAVPWARAGLYDQANQ
ncbi:MAG: hypothetical protein GYA33_15385 [Thermogutta sp.]|nr:hypothetical protein [Thermogutta sp.]